MRIKSASKGKRERIQFYLSPELSELLQLNRTMAKRLGMRIDYQEEFRVWFMAQNREARTALEKLNKEQGKNNAAETD